MENVAMEQNSEYVLYDVLDDIFQHLDIMSLRNVALVSRSWNHFAKKEISKRTPGPLCRVLLPVLYDTDKPEFKAEEFFRTKPNTVLMFCGPRPRIRPVLSLEYKIMGEYHERLPGRMVILGVDQAWMDTNEVLSCGPASFRTAEPTTKLNQILGLCLPESEDLTIEIVECVSHEKKTEKMGADIFNRLHAAAEGVEHPIFLLFSRSAYSIGSHVMRMFKERYAGKPVSLWGSTIADFIKRSDDGYPNYRGTHGFLGILLHGPRLRAHCLVLPITKDESCMLKRLAEFASTLRLRQHNVGLVCGPRNSGRRFSQWLDEDLEPDMNKYYTSEEMMQMVKKEMPSIDFIGMFNNSTYSCFGCDQTSKNEDYSLEHQKALSIMILTYD